MTEVEMLDFVALHASDTDEKIRKQVQECWELIIKRSKELEQEVAHIVVPEGAVATQEMLDEILRKMREYR